MCSRSGAELAAAPSVAGSSGPRRAARRSDACDTARDLKATRAEVLVRQAVAREVEDRPQEQRRKSRPTRRAGGGARGHMERDDHGCPS